MDVERIREDFPILQRKINGKPIIYFDNACASLRPRQVIEAITQYYTDYSGCAGRSAHALSRLTTEAYERARETVAKTIGAERSEEIVFTRNTTEGINLVAYSLGLKKGDVVLTSDKEHNSNLIPWQILSRRDGVEHKIIPSKDDMTFDLEQFKRILEETKVKLVSMVHTSNLDGYTNPAKQISKLSYQHGALVMMDAAQSMPHKQIDVRELGVDFLAFSGHKMLGPSGIGVLYGRYRFLEEMPPFIVGGETVEKTTYDSHIFLKPPAKFEAGLQDYAGAAGLAAAAEFLQSIGKEAIERHEVRLNRIVSEELEKLGVTIIGPPNPELRGSIVSFNAKEINYHDLALLLNDTANVMIRSGQHCVHSWFNAHGIPGSARASFYLYNTEEEVGVFLDALKPILRLR